MVTWPSGKAKVCKTFIHQFKSGRHLFKTCKFCDNSWKCRSFSFLKNSLCCDAMLVSARKLARSPHGAYLPQRQKSDQGGINPILPLALLLENRYNILWIKGSKGRILVKNWCAVLQRQSRQKCPMQHRMLETFITFPRSGQDVIKVFFCASAAII